MKEGSVVFDMAIESGGNVEGSKIDSIENINGVNIVGFSNLPSYVSSHASFALSNNLSISFQIFMIMKKNLLI